MSPVGWNPPNRFLPIVIDEGDGSGDAPDPDFAESAIQGLTVLEDATGGILAHNDSPDLGFDWAVNPYRGCTHACAYCYARTYHEFLGYGAGTDFERIIVVKRDAAALLTEAFSKPSWRGELVAFSGVTDCYQPLERRLGLTRACLEVCVAFRNPVSVVTRSPLVARDVDLLASLAAHGAAAVTVSIPLADRALQQALEPGAPPPEARFRAIAALANAGVPVGVSLSPILPGLTDHALPRTLERAREAGAAWAWTELVRLPGAVATVFERRLRDALPDRADAVLAKIRRMRGGALNDARFGHRRTGRDDDPAWQMVARVARIWKARLGYGVPWKAPSPSPFRRPTPQLGLFGG